MQTYGLHFYLIANRLYGPTSSWAIHYRLHCGGGEGGHTPGKITQGAGTQNP